MYPPRDFGVRYEICWKKFSTPKSSDMLDLDFDVCFHRAWSLGEVGRDLELVVELLGQKSSKHPRYVSISEKLLQRSGRESKRSAVPVSRLQGRHSRDRLLPRACFRPVIRVGTKNPFFEYLDMVTLIALGTTKCQMTYVVKPDTRAR